MYKNADQVFCIAVGDNNENIKFSNLYFHAKNFDIEEQGSSIYEKKSDIKSTFSLPIIKVSPDYYLNFIKSNFEKNYPGYDYEIVLRVNCEGLEYELLKQAKIIFQDRFNLALGSLDDVLKYHGESVYKEMLEFLDNENIDFYQFNTILTTHDAALKKLVAQI